MDHLLVLLFLFVLLIGIWTAFAARQKYLTHGVSIFRSLFLYLVSFNSMVLGYLVAKYAYTNLIGEDPFQYPPLIVAAASLVVFAIESAIAWTVLHLGWQLRDLPPAPASVRILAIAMGLVGVSYVVGITLLLQGGSLTWLAKTHLAMSTLMALVIVLVLTWLVAGQLPGLDRDRRNSARLLCGYLLLGYLALAISVAFTEPAHLVGSAGAFLWLNLATWIWLRRQSQPYCRLPTPDGGAEVIASLAVRHGITKREQEIIQLIVQGKSNKEIQAALCISFSTVKNHAYSVYRKLGVKSRAQLMRLVMDAMQRFERDNPSEGGPA